MSGRGGVAMVVDRQRQFTDPGGSVEVDDGPGPVARVNETVEDTRRVGVPIIWVEQRVRGHLPLSQTSDRFAVSELHRGTWSDLDPALQVASCDRRVVKRRQSPLFYGTDLELTLRRLGVRRLLVAGVATNMCVLATAKDAAERDLDVVTLGDLTACRPIDYTVR